MTKETPNQFAIQYLKDSGMAVNFVLSREDLEAVVRKMINEALSQSKGEKGNELLSRDDVCSILNVSPSTLWKWDKIGYLKKKKVGRSVFYNKRDIMNLADK